MSKNLQFLSILFLGVSIIIGSWLISQSLDMVIKIDQQFEEQYRYEFISANEQNIIIFDKKTGEYWRKYIESTKGPTNWEKQQSPVTSTE